MAGEDQQKKSNKRWAYVVFAAFLALTICMSLAETNPCDAVFASPKKSMTTRCMTKFLQQRNCSSSGVNVLKACEQVSQRRLQATAELNPSAYIPDSAWNKRQLWTFFVNCSVLFEY